MFTANNSKDIPSGEIRGQLLSEKLRSGTGYCSSTVVTGTLKPSTTPDNGSYIWVPDLDTNSYPATFYPDSIAFRQIAGVYSELDTSDDQITGSTLSDLNPLTNELILDNIFKYLDHKNLKTGRLVCKTWNQALFPKFQRSSNVVANFDIFWKSMTEFTKTFSTAYEDGRMYRNLLFFDAENLSHSVLEEWMKKYGKHIQSILLGFEPGLYASMIICEQVLLRWCPNLQHMQIPFPGNGRDFYQNRNKLYTSKQRVVHLKTLEIGRSCLQTPIEKCVMSILKMIKSVESLTLNGWECKTHLRKLSSFLLSGQKHISLIIDSLTYLDLDDHTFDSIAYQKFTKLSFKGLKFLKIDILSAVTKGELSTATTLPLPEMPALRTLHVFLDNWEIGSLDFLVALPNLVSCRTVTLSTKVLEETPSLYLSRRSLELEKQKHLTLEAFEFVSKSNQTIFKVEKLVKCFPNLKKLITPESSDDISEVLYKLCQLKKLEHLEIEMKCQSEGFNEAVIKFLPQISALKKLKFRCTDEEENIFWITEETVLNGFFKASKLVSLILCGFEFLPEVKKLLQSKDNSLKVEIHSEHDYNHFNVYNYSSDSEYGYDSSDDEPDFDI